jgi:hypothetical protein
MRGHAVTALTMPACAVPLAGTHAYPMAPNRGREKAPAMAAALAVTQTPVLPDGFHWANGPEVNGPRLLLDVPTVALLLFAADLDPWAVGDHAIVAACHEQLLVSYGTTAQAQRVYEHELVFGREVAEARLRACTARATQLLNTEA